MHWLRTWWQKLDESLLIAASAIVIGVLIFIRTADAVIAGASMRIDRGIVEWVAHLNTPAWLDEVMRDLTALGGIVVLALVTIACAGYLAARDKWRALVTMLLAIGGGVLLSLVLKHLFQRDRPDIIPHGSYVMTTSFPSGHAMLSAVVWLTLGSMLSRLEKSRLLKAYFVCLGLFVSFLVGISRVWLGVHWPTDVLAGWSAGCVWATLCWFATRSLQHHGAIEQPSDNGSDAALAPKQV